MDWALEKSPSLIDGTCPAAEDGRKAPKKQIEPCGRFITCVSDIWPETTKTVE